MIYKTESPEAGEVSHTIPLVERCPQLLAVFEALRHECQPPDLSEFDTDSEPPLSTRSKSTFTSDQSQSLTNKQTLAPFQHTVVPPTDAECGLPSALSAALAEIPTSLLPLSRLLAAPEKAAVINGHTRIEISEALAHAANIRRATGRARAILVIASSERAVQEWITGMCQALDEVQVISYSRTKTRRDATLSRLRQQYPGIVVAAEKTLRDGIRELWEVLRQNRVAKKWEIVISEMVVDKNIEGECSPLRMIRDGMAEKGVLVAKKGLTKAKACTFATNLRGVDVDKRFWLSRTDIQNIPTEESQEETDGGKSLLEDINKHIADKNVVKPNGRKSKLPAGKENRVRPKYPARGSSKASKETSKTTQPAQGMEKSLRKISDTAKRERCSNELSLQADRVVKAVPSTNGTRETSGGMLKSRKSKEPSPRAKTTNITSSSGSVVMSAEFEELLLKKGGTKGSRKSSEIRAERTVRKRNSSDRVKRARLRDAVAEVMKKTTLKNGMSPGGPIKPPVPRRRSPRLSPTLSSNEQSAASAAGKDQPKQRKRRTSEVRKEEDEPGVSRSIAAKKKASASLGSSNLSSINKNGLVSNSEEDGTTWSRKTREKFETRARTLRLYDSESSNSADEKFYTPPSHAPTPQSKDTTPEKFYSPRTSFSPKQRATSDQLGPRSLPPSRRSKSPIVEQAIPKSHKSSSEKVLASGSPSSPVKIAHHIRKKKRRPDMTVGSSDDQPLAEIMRKLKEKKRRHAVATAVKADESSDDQLLASKLHERRQKAGHPAVSRASRNRRWDPADSSSDDQPLVRKLSDVKRNTRQPLIATPLKDKGPNLADESTSVQPSVRKISGVKQTPVRRVVKEAFTPPPVKRSFPSGVRCYYGASAAGSKESRRRSVFEGLMSSEGRSSIPDASTSRARSFPGPVRQVKREHSPQSNGLRWRSENSKRNRTNVTDRRKSFPKSSLSASILPVEKVLPELAKNSPAATAAAICPRQSPMSNGRNNNNAERKSSIRTVPTQSSPVVPEVIVISSGSEDEATPRRERDSKKRKIYDDECRDDSRNAIRGRPREHTASRNKPPSPVVAHPRDRLANGSASQSRRTHPNGTAAVRSNDLASFVRGVNRNRKLRDLSHQQMVQYNKYLWEAKRYESMGLQKEAYDTYEKCFAIYDGDEDLVTRILSIASKQGYLRRGDFSRRHPKSPVKKRSSRRRRNSGRRGQAGPSSSRLEVIDLTSS